jgi:UDP-glucose 4-epimerase
MDLGAAHIKALDVLEGQERLISNVGRGAGVSVRELVSTVEKALGTKVNVTEKPIRPGDPPELVADNGRLKTWFPHTFKSVGEVVSDLAGALEH